MSDSVMKLFKSKGATLVMCGFFSMFGIPGTASADCITQEGVDPSVFTLLVDSTSNCGNMSSNMYGCDVDPATGSCTITNPLTNETITVNLTSGAVGAADPIDWSTSDPLGSKIDFVIIVGATGGGTCGTSYTPGSDFGAGLAFEKTNGSYQKVNSVSFCADFVEPALDVPRLVVTKTVTTEADTTCSSSVNELEVAAGDDVRYCYMVENVGIGLAESVTLEDDAGTPADTSDDFFVMLMGLNGDGSLDSGGTAKGMSGLVNIAEAGTIVNTATATATGLDGTVTVTATDTATVTAELVAEICPENFQKAVNQLSQDTGLDYAFLLDPNQGGRLSVCAPNGAVDPDTGKTSARSIRVACIDQCVTKPICETTPTDPTCSPSVCEPSGNWTTVDASDACVPVTSLSADALPYCWEVQQDLNGDCTLNEWEPQEESVHQVKKGHVNPYVYQSCYKSGGRYICETMCFAYSEDDAEACPPGSTVY